MHPADTAMASTRRFLPVEQKLPDYAEENSIVWPINFQNSVRIDQRIRHIRCDNIPKRLMVIIYVSINY